MTGFYAPRSAPAEVRSVRHLQAGRRPSAEGCGVNMTTLRNALLAVLPFWAAVALLLWGWLR